jgi:hypothetical protein
MLTPSDRYIDRAARATRNVRAYQHKLAEQSQDKTVEKHVPTILGITALDGKDGSTRHVLVGGIRNNDGLQKVDGALHLIDASVLVVNVNVGIFHGTVLYATTRKANQRAASEQTARKIFD